MSEVPAAAANQQEAAPSWPGAKEPTVNPPVTQAALCNAAARAAASNSRRDLVEYLRLRRKSA